MLWTVEGTQLCLIGSIHCADAPLTLSARESECIRSASIVATEVQAGVQPSLSKGFFRGGHLSSAISSGLFVEALALWKRLGIDADLESHRPWLAALVTIAHLKAEWGFSDSHSVELLVKPMCAGKSCFALEPAVAALDAMAEAPAREQEAFLEGAVVRQREGREVLGTICSAWRDDQPEALMPIVQKQLAETPKMQSAIIGKRNRSWMKHLLRFAESPAPTVVVVGALHFVGPSSLPELFATKGYTCAFQR